MSILDEYFDITFCFEVLYVCLHVLPVCWVAVRSVASVWRVVVYQQQHNSSAARNWSPPLSHSSPATTLAELEARKGKMTERRHKKWHQINKNASRRWKVLMETKKTETICALLLFFTLHNNASLVSVTSFWVVGLTLVHTLIVKGEILQDESGALCRRASLRRHQSINLPPSQFWNWAVKI